MKKPAKTTLSIGADYRRFDEELKTRVISARISAARAISHEVILLNWGDSVVEILAAELQRSFPGVKGFSSANIWRMRQFYLVHSEEKFLALVVRDFASAVPGHHVLMLGRMKSPEEHFWYLRATARLGWSRNVLLNQIKAGAYERPAGALRRAGRRDPRELLQPRIPRPAPRRASLAPQCIWGRSISSATTSISMSELTRIGPRRASKAIHHSLPL